MANGSRHSAYYVEETAEYGKTPANPALQTLRLTGMTLGLGKDSLQSEEIRSDRQIADFRLGANNVAGDINFELSLTSFDDFIAAVMLADNWNSNIAKCGQKRRSFTMVRVFEDLNDTNKVYIYRGVELNAMSLSISASAMVTGSFSVVGKSQEIATSINALGTTTTTKPATTTAPMDSFTGSLKEGGSEIAVITEISLQLENGLEPRFVVGSKDTIKPSVGRSNLTGNISAYFEDSNLIKKFINETRTSIELVITDGAAAKFTITLPNIVFTGGQPDVTGEGPILLSIPFQAILDPTQKTNLIIKRSS